MSQHIFFAKENTDKPLRIVMGYDRFLDYFFCTVDDCKGNVKYSNLSDRKAGTDLKDANYFVRLLKSKFGIQVPKRILLEVEMDRETGGSNRTIVWDERKGA